MQPDKDGWFPIAAVSALLSSHLSMSIDRDRVISVVRTAKFKHFEIDGDKIRPTTKGSQHSPNRVTPPDILYYPCGADFIEELRALKQLHPRTGRQIHLVSDEAAAWRLAHRVEDQPRVLYIDAARASRFGTRFFRHQKNGHYLTRRVHLRDILNMLPKFAHQYSAGGIPVRWDTDEPMLLMCKVKRRSGTTWEVAKGKLEPCETPEYTAVREVHEELGFTLPMHPTLHVGDIRYGFIAPGGLPRLKTVHMYLLESNHSWEGVSFVPALAEGIIEVNWFNYREACDIVTHSSLIPVMRHVRDVLDKQRKQRSELDNHTGST